MAVIQLKYKNAIKGEVRILWWNFTIYRVQIK